MKITGFIPVFPLILLAVSLEAQSQLRPKTRGIYVEPKPGESETTTNQPVIGQIDNNWGLIVGVDRFDDANIPPLEFAVSDARKVHEAFTDRLFPDKNVFFHHTEGDLKPTKEAVLSSLEKINDSANKDSFVFLYVSTHGFNFEDEEDTSQVYFVTEDATLEDIEQSMLTLNQLAGALKDKRGALIIFDACRNDPRKKVIKVSDTRSLSTDAGELFERVYSQVAGFSRLEIVFPCSRGEVSREDREIGGGVFTHFFLAAMNDPQGERRSDGCVTVENAVTYAAGHLRTWAASKGFEPIVPLHTKLQGESFPLAYIPLPKSQNQTEPPVSQEEAESIAREFLTKINGNIKIPDLEKDITMKRLRGPEGAQKYEFVQPRVKVTDTGIQISVKKKVKKEYTKGVKSTPSDLSLVLTLREGKIEKVDDD